MVNMYGVCVASDSTRTRTQRGERRERREECSETLRAPRFGDSKSNHILRYSERERRGRGREETTKTNNKTYLFNVLHQLEQGGIV